MLDLEKLEKEIDSFLANQTSNSYQELFKVLDEERMVKLSGGYTEDFDCSDKIIVNTTTVFEVSCDFSENDYNEAA
ncbi:hypothetical protein HDF19_09975 [Mucilaginibacter sp. E4BP6]|uniref:hypothetical protein n=1 Tax=Mucilaginibacter sp. E4BP6 TaxID=2723089 RepID=UPI0015CD86CB|nr:hypothetical protein [Mucilaginibacter sp. E4BP6]NYE67802.1 hypothetical protein [Mucilaginibacter sp. E4BP6]